MRLLIYSSITTPYLNYLNDKDGKPFTQQLVLDKITILVKISTE